MILGQSDEFRTMDHFLGRSCAQDEGDPRSVPGLCERANHRQQGSNAATRRDHDEVVRQFEGKRELPAWRFEVDDVADCRGVLR